MVKIPVDLGERSYQIIIGQGILAELGEMLSQLATSKKCLIVSNPTVYGLYGEKVYSSLANHDYEPAKFLVEDDEKAKSLEWVTQLYDQAVELQLKRNSPVIALGGGVVGDLAGFFAATYMRGVPFIQVPTTLLALVDSSVGGKVGINHPRGKNLIGAFYQPRLVLADLTTLESLPKRELRAGMAEVIKYGVIWDREFFSYLEENAPKALDLDLNVLEKIVATSCAIKAEIVAKDEREQGLRAILNFGHTIGHALEALTDFQVYRHGEAVSIGMVAAARIAVQKGILDSSLYKRLYRLLKSVGLPVEIPPNITAEKLIQSLLLDKKNKDSTITLVLPEDLGKMGFYYFAPEELLKCIKY